MCSQLLGVLMSNAETTNHCSAPWSNLEIFVFSLKCFVVRATMRTRLPRSPSASWCHQSTTSVFIAVWDTCDRNDEIKQCVDVICLLKVVKYSPQMSILCFWTTSHTITSCWFVVRLLLSIKLCSCRAVCAKTAKQWKCYTRWTSVPFCQHVPVSEGGNYLLLSPRQRYLEWMADRSTVKTPSRVIWRTAETLTADQNPSELAGCLVHDLLNAYMTYIRLEMTH